MKTQLGKITDEYEIIDFHTHPFTGERDNICLHAPFCGMSAAATPGVFRALGVDRICGSVISNKPLRDGETHIDRIRENNNSALELQKEYGGFYIPGFHVHPDYVTQSCEEIERFHARGIRLIGELVPYMDGWSDYSVPALDEIIDTAEQYGMVISFHSMGNDEIDKMVKKHPRATFVAAHPGEYGDFMRHMERMKMSENYYLDLSGYGIFRYGMLRHAVDLFGAERFIFGSDYPICSPAMYLGGVLFDDLINEREKRLILAENAKRLLGL